MLDKIILFSIRNKPVVGLLTLALIIWGVWSAIRLPIDAVPDITNNQVQVITRAPTLASQEVEQYVTYPVEQSLVNLPGLEEIRSISRFGLSVITIVFQDDIDVYFARQLIHERLMEAEEKIPPAVGRPEMGPVSTGLGEVYQYVIHPRKGSEDKYSAMDLRTMQDWIVARQLYGTPGVAEINSFGGLVKEYEVAVNPERLRSLGITVPEIFRALEQNNENTGGAYIDKKPNAWYIRGIGLITSMEDIRNIVVKKTEAGIPVLIRNVAEVREGSAVRYGAVTRNGEKEVVGGIVMMLKGSNSVEVVSHVKEKIKAISRSLPEDVAIEPFLDRTNLINRTIHTVEKNLIEGALIVIFVLVIFLGNLRAGLIVASAIPLSLLFALGMMHQFGVSANLMSLGAIDFGLIVDGAVIVVEAVMHHLGLRKYSRKLTRVEMDAEVFAASSKIRSSAAFGELIILIVYLPILALTGIEGKMFRPMAQTVSFAILGALLLSLTYIPMMCAMFLPRQLSDKPNIANRIMDVLRRQYIPLIQKAIVHRYQVIAAAVLLFIVSLIGFFNMGGEFIPQLEEGDYAFHCILPPGTSLSQSIETSMQASRILQTFPEVKDVIVKTGTAEVPTDPMPPEVSDLIITLKPIKEWTTTKDYRQLAQLMEEKLQVIPGVVFETNQPIQMRFNELMTGIRQDVAIKIFGENMETLTALATETGLLLQDIPGITTPQVEKTTGLPQITVTYDRMRLAGYGLNIADVNNILTTAFAGKSAGVIFENERRFALVVRLDSMFRTSIEDVGNLYLPIHDGNQIPLKQVATVAFKEGPAQISRESGQRRVVIGFNVRGRDVQSVIGDIRSLLDKNISLPEGYYYTFGGTFENLEKAKSRLGIVVPAALLLIWMLLYFTFHAARQALLIFTAIPMSAIGGIGALWLRDMPFSISAGVGFIALFGVAVLNGIVLIATFNQLEKDGMKDSRERVIRGLEIRLRPVLMTAMVASFGFLPMAISTSAGAEVQKPLATVVIGGLISATLLTLFVLPLLYLLTEPKNKKMLPAGVILLLFLFMSISPLKAQEPLQGSIRISLEAALDSAYRNNLGLQVEDMQIQQSGLLTGTAFQMSKTGIFFENEDLTPYDDKGILKIGIQQSIEWPGVYMARKKQLREKQQLTVHSYEQERLTLRMEVTKAYYQLWFFQDKIKLYQRLDSLYTQLSEAAALRVKTGEAAGMEQIAADARRKEIQAQYLLLHKEAAIQQELLKRLMHTTELPLPEQKPLDKLEPSLTATAMHPLVQMRQQEALIAATAMQLQRRQMLPDFSGRFFSQRLYGVSPPFSGFSLSLSVPLFATAYVKQIQASNMEKLIREKQLEAEQKMLSSARQHALHELEKNKTMLDYYEYTGKHQAEAIISAATLGYHAGSISFADLSLYLTQAVEISTHHLEYLNLYNQSVIQLRYFLNQ